MSLNAKPCCSNWLCNLNKHCTLCTNPHLVVLIGCVTKTNTAQIHTMRTYLSGIAISAELSIVAVEENTFKTFIFFA